MKKILLDELQQKTVIEAYLTPMTLRQVSIQTGFSEATCYRALVLNDIPRRSRAALVKKKMPEIHDGMKKCVKCGEWRPLLKYKARKGCLGGRGATCAFCVAPINKAAQRSIFRSWYLRNREIMIEKERIWAQKNPEKVWASREAGRPRKNAARREVEARGRQSEYTRQWRAGNPEKLREQSRRYALRYPEKRKANAVKNKARRRGVIGSFSGKDWLALCDKYGNICLRCGQHGELTADHIIPTTHAGSTNCIENIQPLCLACNAKKSNRVICDYRPDRSSILPAGQMLAKIARIVHVR